MKKDKIIEKIKFHQETKKYAKISREVSNCITLYSHGFILGHSKNFILLQETDDFRVLGFQIFPIEQIKKVRFNKWDKYYDKILQWEGEKDKIGIEYLIDLKNWKTIFESIKNTTLNVIVECESSDIDSFTIGPIEGIGKKEVVIANFDPEGYFDDEPSSIDYTSITKVQFNEHYVNILSKYTRRRTEIK